MEASILNGYIFTRWKTLLVICGMVIISFVAAEAQLPCSYQWSNVQIGGGGYVSGIITSKTQPKLMYIRTDVGGAYRWDSLSLSWIPLQDFISENDQGLYGVESIALDPNNPAKLYMLAGTSYWSGGKTVIFRSEDYGASFSIVDVTSKFKAHGNGNGRWTGEKLAVDPKNSSILYCGTRYNGLFKSIDGGINWNRLTSLAITTTPSDNGISFVLIDTTGSSDTASLVLIAGISVKGAVNLYRSDDAGLSFSPVEGAIRNLMPGRAALTSDRKLYITYADIGPSAVDSGAVWKYNLQDSSWTNVTPAGITRPFGGISADPANPERLVLSTMNTWWFQPGGAYGDHIYLTSDGGTSWVDVIQRGYKYLPNGNKWNDYGQIHWAGSIEFDPFNTRQAYVISGNGLFMTSNIDSTINVWKFHTRGLEETVPLDLISIKDGPVISVIGDYDGFRHMDVSTYVPRLKPSIGSSQSLAYAPLNAGMVVRAGNAVQYSTDQGITWKAWTTKASGGKVAVSADGESFLHCPGASTTTYWASTAGGSWTACTGLSIKDARPYGDPVNPLKFYVYDRQTGSMKISNDKGKTFTTAGNAGSWGSERITVVPGYEGHLWLAMYNSGLKFSNNSGTGFTKISAVKFCSAVGVGKAGAGSSYPTLFIWGTIGTTTGLFRSTDMGISWVRINDDMHQFGGPGNGQFVVGDANIFGRVYMSTVGRGIIYGSDPADCRGVCGGNAWVDNCLVCREAEEAGCEPDCNGDYNGTAFIDSCGYCAGGNTGKDSCNNGVGYSEQLQIRLSPNPTSQSAVLEVPQGADYRMYNVFGELAASGERISRCIIGEALRPGIYFLVVEVANSRQTIRFIKQ